MNTRGKRLYYRLYAEDGQDMRGFLSPGRCFSIVLLERR